METTSTNNVSNEFTTTTTTNAVETTPANLELAKLQGELQATQLELEHLRRSLDTAKEVSTNKSATIVQSIGVLVKELDGVDIADIIVDLPKQKIIDVVRLLANMNASYVKDGIESSINANEFNTEIDNLDDYISDNYNDGQIVDLIDNKYSWSDILSLAFRRGSIETDDVTDYIEKSDLVFDEIRSGNIDFSDMMNHFDSSDCYEWLNDNGDLNWSDVKDYIDMDDVKADIEIDTDMVSEYISNLDNNEFRTLITNLS